MECLGCYDKTLPGMVHGVEAPGLFMRDGGENEEKQNGFTGRKG